MIVDYALEGDDEENSIIRTVRDADRAPSVGEFVSLTHRVNKAGVMEQGTLAMGDVIHVGSCVSLSGESQVLVVIRPSWRMT